jgi:predicted pyridoxine 5'-phosphate oxidase superfamily flavin-nucleotide-binding protein
MGKVHESIDDRIRAFIEAQQMFFVATAPLDGAGHINLSPKGLDALRVLGPRTVAYLDHVGSGAETIAHLGENGRVVLMWCAFDGPPKILRAHGHGEVLEPGDPAYVALRGLFPAEPAGRAIIRVEIERLSDSCGFGVPLYGYKGQRSQLPDWAQRKGEAGLVRYQREHNRLSIDSLPALRWPGAAPEPDNRR